MLEGEVWLWWWVRALKWSANMGTTLGNGGHAEKEEEFSELWSNFWERLSRWSVAGLGIVKTKWEETVKLKE